MSVLCQQAQDRRGGTEWNRQLCSLQGALRFRDHDVQNSRVQFESSRVSVWEVRAESESQPHDQQTGRKLMENDAQAASAESEDPIVTRSDLGFNGVCLAGISCEQKQSPEVPGSVSIFRLEVHKWKW